MLTFRVPLQIVNDLGSLQMHIMCSRSFSEEKRVESLPECRRVLLLLVEIDAEERVRVLGGLFIGSFELLPRHERSHHLTPHALQLGFIVGVPDATLGDVLSQ